jgi:hypothetical protein
MRWLTAAIVSIALVTTSCGGSQPTGGTGATTPNSGSASTHVPNGGGPTKSCGSLTARDIVHVGSTRPSKEETLANSPGSRLHCSDVFADSSGGLILQLTEARGGRAALIGLRRASASEQGAASIRHLTRLGPEAFVARRMLGFVRGDQLVTLQTGYSADGKLHLTSAQLVRLAAIVAAHP